MNVLITGANGFIGRNLIDRFSRMPEITVLPYHHTDSETLLIDYCRKADFVFHFASVCRPKDPSEFLAGNYGSLRLVLDTLESCKNTCPVLFTSSIQAAMEGRFTNSEYGRTKRMAEELLMVYGERTGTRVMYYRLPHLFGKWGVPNYNNVMHTFCYNIANDLPISIIDPNIQLNLIWIDDLMDQMLNVLESTSVKGLIPLSYIQNATLGQVADKLQSFKNGIIPSLMDRFACCLYSSFLSYCTIAK